MSSINLLYVHAGWIGYGRVGVNVARELEEMGVTVYDHLEGSEHHYNLDNAAVPPPLQRDDVPTQVQIEGRKAGRSNVACWISVPSHGTGWFEGQVPVVFTMWEGMRLPEQFRESLHRFDTVVVPSPQNFELFSRYHDNVKYVPLGFDPKVWHYQPRPPADKTFNFMVAGSGGRKGGDLVVKAFKKLWGKGGWGDGPIPNLIMKSPKGESFYGERISTVGGYLPVEEEVALYGNAHCYVQPSRGEGFGLQPLQAIAQGIPTILTDAHGHESFSYLGIPIGWEAKQSDYFIFGDAGDWWEPNFDDLCDAMKDVYKNYEKYEESGVSRSHDALHFTWYKTAEGLVDAIGEDRLGPYVGNGEFYEVDRLNYKVITKRDWSCEIADTKFFFERGKEYWQMADVKRILFEAGLLDPRCLDDDEPDASGLTDAQLLKADKYRAEHSHCPMCGTPLSEAPCL